MTTVTFATFCHEPHLGKLHAPGVLREIVQSHQATFDEVLVVHQRCKGLQYRPITEVAHRVLESENYYPQIYDCFHIDLNNPISARDCHGPDAAHWWVWHTLNHLITLEEAKGEFIVFSDCDCLIVSRDQRSWVDEAIDILNRYPDVLIVGPSDGGSMAEKRIPEARLTRNVSQQLFIANRDRLKVMDWDIPFNWEKTAPGGPFQEFYHLAEGRIWRYLDQQGLWRAILPDRWRYWHFNPWEPQGWIEAGRP